MKAAILTIGDEITDGEITNTNAQWMAEQLSLLGGQVVLHMTVRDHPEDMKWALDQCREKSQLIFICGGLGPTTDDLTRDIFAQWLNVKLAEDELSLQRMEARLARLSVDMLEGHRRQCSFPIGAKVIENSVGTASGFINEKDGLRIIVLPGPPPELKSVWSAGVEAYLRSLDMSKDRVLHYWRCLGRGESDIAGMVEKVFSGSGFQLGYRASHPYVIVKVWVPTDKSEVAEAYFAQLESAIGPYIVGRDRRDPVDQLLELLGSFESITVFDEGSRGHLASRLRAHKDRDLPLRIFSTWQDGADETLAEQLATECNLMLLRRDDKNWEVGLSVGELNLKKTIQPPERYRPGQKRAEMYAAEIAIQTWIHYLQAR